MPLGMEVGLSPGDLVFDEDPATPEKKAQHPHPIFGPCLLWPAKRLDGSKCHLVRRSTSAQATLLDGVAAPPRRGTAPVFDSRLLWPNGWMDEDATWYGSRPRPRPHCIRRGPGSP